MSGARMSSPVCRLNLPRIHTPCAAPPPAQNKPPEGHLRHVHTHTLVCYVRHMYVVSPPAKVITRSRELTQQMLAQLPAGASRYTLPDLVRAIEAVLALPPPPPPSADRRAHVDDGAAADATAVANPLVSKQLRALRARLVRNRLTMPLFDTRGWVRDFEKALKIQWEIYANGRLPMHVVVGRSDRIYGIVPVVEAVE